MTFEFEPLSPRFGSEARGVDASRLFSDSDFAELERAFFGAQVLVLPAQSLTPAQYVAFARRSDRRSRTSSISSITRTIRTS
ncbi:MAG TPA: TauD/TfdA family dioxygenase [Casimicrobiaceae bacterium]|nr:TauD/TfdA family dioxygenase [Casimicrobiaceae bacterium]